MSYPSPGPSGYSPDEFGDQNRRMGLSEYMHAVRERDAVVKSLCERVRVLEEAARRGLNYIEATEGEFGITLGCGDALRAALAPGEVKP